MKRVLLMLVGILFVASGIWAVPSAQSRNAVIKMTSGSMDFAPKQISVGLKERVTWINDSKEVHLVTSMGAVPGGGMGASTPSLNHNVLPGTDYSFAFDTPGTFFYYCPIHSGMWGMVTVK